MALYGCGHGTYGLADVSIRHLSLLLTCLPLGISVLVARHIALSSSALVTTVRLCVSTPTSSGSLRALANSRLFFCRYQPAVDLL